MATFWRTFHHDGKISLSLSGYGVHAHPLFTLFTFTYKQRAGTLTLFHLYPNVLCGNAWDTHYCSVAQGIFWLSTERLSRSTFHLKERGRGESVLLYSVVLQLWRTDASVRIVTKSPKVGPLLLWIFSISLGNTNAVSRSKVLPVEFRE
jgi:hypothetical protein